MLSRTLIFIFWQAQWYIKDLSRNGTLVNGSRIEKSVARELKEGDEITVSISTAAAAKAVHVKYVSSSSLNFLLLCLQMSSLGLLAKAVCLGRDIDCGHIPSSL